MSEKQTILQLQSDLDGSYATIDSLRSELEQVKNQIRMNERVISDFNEKTTNLEKENDGLRNMLQSIHRGQKSMYDHDLSKHVQDTDTTANLINKFTASINTLMENVVIKVVALENRVSNLENKQ